MSTHQVGSLATSAAIPGEGLVTRPSLSDALVVTPPIVSSLLALHESEVS
jgi:hypothetical protein